MADQPEQARTIIREELEYLGKRAELSRNIIMKMSLQPNERKEAPVFSAGRVAEILERTVPSVSRVIKDLGLAGPDPQENRYAIDQAAFNRIREHYKLVPTSRHEGAKVIVIENQKGGVGKTTTVAHLAPWAALHGYRTLVIDADSQASFTAYQGLNPDIELTEEDTISPILTGETNSDGTPARLSERIRKAPHIDNLWFIPSCLELANGDVGAYKRQFVSQSTNDGYVFFNRLKLAIDEIRRDYDLIIIDCPPHISAITYNSVYAADMMLIPLGTHMLDLASTARFIDWLNLIMEQLPGAGIQRIRFLVTNYDEQPASRDNLQVIRSVLGDHVLKVNALHSAEIQRAGTLFKSIYEVPKFIGSREAWSRAGRTMDAVNREVMAQIEELWAAMPALAA